jgi:hypothetical protein
MSEQQKDSCQPLFARIEKLVSQIFFVSNVPCQQISYEPIGQSVFSVENLHHRLLLNTQKVAICHCSCRSHAERLTCEATFTKKVAVTQYAYGCFLANLGYDSESNLAFLDVEDCVSRSPLREDFLFLSKDHNFPALADRGKKCIGIKIALVLNTHNCRPALDMKVRRENAGV